MTAACGRGRGHDHCRDIFLWLSLWMGIASVHERASKRLVAVGRAVKDAAVTVSHVGLQSLVYSSLDFIWQSYPALKYEVQVTDADPDAECTQILIMATLTIDGVEESRRVLFSNGLLSWPLPEAAAYVDGQLGLALTDLRKIKGGGRVADEGPIPWARARART